MVESDANQTQPLIGTWPRVNYPTNPITEAPGNTAICTFTVGGAKKCTGLRGQEDQPDDTLFRVRLKNVGGGGLHKKGPCRPIPTLPTDRPVHPSHIWVDTPTYYTVGSKWSFDRISNITKQKPIMSVSKFKREGHLSVPLVKQDWLRYFK